MMRVSRPVSRGNTALAHAFEIELEPDPVAYDNVVPMSQRLSLLELNEATCHWPVGDPSSPEFFFCGGKALPACPIARITRVLPISPPATAAAPAEAAVIEKLFQASSWPRAKQRPFPQMTAPSTFSGPGDRR